MGKRINIKLDPESFASLERIKKRHRDASYTDSIKRVIANLYFFDEQTEKGNEFFLGSIKDNRFYRIVIPS